MESLTFPKTPLPSVPRPRFPGRFQASLGGKFPPTKPVLSGYSRNALRPPPGLFARVVSVSAASPGTGGGSGGGELGASGSGGGGDGGPSGGSPEAPPLAADEISPLDTDAIILSVQGMMCGGCVASVKRILESQPDVSSATVSLETETAVICVVPQVKVTQNWQEQLGEKLANHLTTCGFKSNIKVIKEELWRYLQEQGADQEACSPRPRYRDYYRDRDHRRRSRSRI